VKSKGTWTKFARKCDGCFNRKGKPYPLAAAGNPNSDPIAGDSLIGPGLIPACVSSCPTGALQYGGRATVVAAANTIAADAVAKGTYPCANVYGAFIPALRVISVLTQAPAFYDLP
jgi:Fe-S-cluster-containing dehydrogenase component